MHKNVLRLLVAGVLGLALVSMSAPAQAQDDDDDIDLGDDDDDIGTTGDDDDDDDDNTTGGAGAGADVTTVMRPLILPEGTFLLTGGVLISLNNDFFQPFSLNPDVWYGLMPKLMVGLVHSPQAYTGFYAGSGLGLCLTGESGGCADVYGNPGLVGRYEIMTGDIDLVADGGLMFFSLADATVALKLGVLGRWVSGKIAVYLNPNLFIGLTDRSVDLMGVSIPINSERLHIPIGATYAVDDKITAGAQTGIAGFLDGFSDNWAGILALAGWYKLSAQLKAGVVFSFDNLYGNGGGFDDLSLQLTGGMTF